MRDGTACQNTASVPKDFSVTCKMPAHVEQLFGPQMRELGLRDNLAGFLAHQVFTLGPVTARITATVLSR